MKMDGLFWTLVLAAAALTFFAVYAFVMAQ